MAFGRHREAVAKNLNTPRLLLRWYSNTQSLILDGEEANNIQYKLLLLAHEDQQPLDEYNINDENLDLSSNSY